MLDNHLYNLMHQMTQEHKSLWRIKNHYKNDAGDCDECQKFWEKMEADKENNVKQLQNLMEKHMK